ncbi:hypothetical protein ACQ5SO_02945 [Rhodovulum sp. DZ06]|uniref:hypothetical protein n=1 Tax=Rhodovulum sp. DZ06 TaxID=3425126 RepID=UPI003D352D99
MAASSLAAVMLTPGGGLAIVVNRVDPVPARVLSVLIDGARHGVRGVDTPRRRLPGEDEATPDESKLGLLLDATTDMLPGLQDRIGATVTLVGED